MIYIFTTKFIVLVVSAIFLIQTAILGTNILTLQKHVKNLENKPAPVVTKTVVVTPTGSPTPSLKVSAKPTVKVTTPAASQGAVAR